MILKVLDGFPFVYFIRDVGGKMFFVCVKRGVEFV